MKESTSIGSFADLSSARAGQRSQVAREKWEESWVAQQRAVTAVVTGQSRESSETIDVAATRTMTANNEVTRDITASKQSQHPVAAHTEAVAADIVDKAESHTSRTRVATTVPSAAHMPSPVDAKSLSDDAHVASAHDLPPPRDAFKRFAFWRDGKTLDAAMRLRDPAEESGRIIAQLRQWLGDVGLRLRSVVVNGRITWEQQSGGRAPQAQPPAKVNRYI